MIRLRSWCGFCFLAVSSACLAQAGLTTRASISSLGIQGNGNSTQSSMAADGRIVALRSVASTLVSGDTNSREDIFVHDRRTGETTRVSLSTSGVQGNNHSFSPAIGADGRHVAFVSFATNLVAGDTNNRADIFVHDRQTGVTLRVSVSSLGVQADRDSSDPTISEDGRFIAYDSDARNLVPNDTNQLPDVFVYDMQTGETTRASLANGGGEANSMSTQGRISADGKHVAFRSFATNLVGGDANQRPDIFVHDRETLTTSLVSLSIDEVQANSDSQNPSISGDGRYVAFDTLADNLVPGDTNGTPDVFVRDTLAGTTMRASVSSEGGEGDGASADAALSANGRSVAFFSHATNLVPGVPLIAEHVLLHDLETGATTRMSVTTGGEEANSISRNPAIDATGRFVVFESMASNLVPLDTNSWTDVFVRDRRAAVVVPFEFHLIKGVILGGNLDSLARSDDNRLDIRPGVVFTTFQPPVQINVVGQSPTMTPSTIELAVEASATTSNIEQTVSLFNFVTLEFEVLSVGTATLEDSVVARQITSNSNRFIGPNAEVYVRVTHRARGPVFVFPWHARIDQVKWTIAD